MVHSRTSRGKQNQEQRRTRHNIVVSLKTKIRQEAWHDNKLAETVCLTSRQSLVDYGYTVFRERFSTAYIPDVDTAFIISDSRGRGAMQ